MYRYIGIFVALYNYAEVPIYRYEINHFRSKYCEMSQVKKHNRTQIISKIMTSEHATAL